MAQRGLVGYLTVSVDYVGSNYMSVAQMQEMYDAGLDIVVHGLKNHNDASLTTQQLLSNEIVKNRDFVLGNGWGRGAKVYVYPGGIINSTRGSKEILANLGFEAARIVTAGASPAHQVMTSPWGIDDPFALPARTLSGAYSATSDLSLADRAIDNGASVIYYGHEIVRTTPTTDQMTYLALQEESVTFSRLRRCLFGMVDSFD